LGPPEAVARAVELGAVEPVGVLVADSEAAEGALVAEHRAGESAAQPARVPVATCRLGHIAVGGWMQQKAIQPRK